MQKQTYKPPSNHGSGQTGLSNASHYLCCCQRIHVKSGTYIIGVLECVGVVLQLLSVLAEVWEKKALSSEFWITILCLCFFTLVVASLFVSVHCQLPWLLILHLAIQVIAIVMVGMAAVLIVVLMLLNATDTLSNLFVNEEIVEEEMKYRPSDYSVLLTSGLIAFCYSFATGMEIWFLLVVWRCYQFLRHELDDRKSTFQMHAIAEH